MVPSDSNKSNISVAETLVVRKSITTPLLKTQNLMVQNDFVIENGAQIINNNIGGAVTNIFNNINVVTIDTKTVDAETVNTTTANVGTLNATTINTTTENTTTLNATTTNTILANAVTNTTLDLVLGVGNVVHITTPGLVASRNYSVVDVGANASFVMTEGVQTLNGAKTFGTSIFLPTTGGTATALTYYEEFAGTLDFTSDLYAGARTVDVHFTRVGRAVTMVLKGFTTSVTIATPDRITTSSFPARFRPNVNFPTINSIINIYDNNVRATGVIEINASGEMIVSASTAGGNFGTLGDVGFLTCNLSWST